MKSVLSKCLQTKTLLEAQLFGVLQTAVQQVQQLNYMPWVGSCDSRVCLIFKEKKKCGNEVKEPEEETSILGRGHKMIAELKWQEQVFPVYCINTHNLYIFLT